MNTLYELTSELASAQVVLEDLDLSADEIDDNLAGLTCAIEEKVLAIASVIMNMEAFSDAIAIERDRLKRKHDAAKNRIERLKAYVGNCMALADLKKVAGVSFSVSRRSNPPSVNVVNEELIPANYIVTETVERIDKKLLLEHLKCGMAINGCELKTSESVRIG